MMKIRAKITDFMMFILRVLYHVDKISPCEEGIILTVCSSNYEIVFMDEKLHNEYCKKCVDERIKHGRI